MATTTKSKSTKKPATAAKTTKKASTTKSVTTKKTPIKKTPVKTTVVKKETTAKKTVKTPVTPLDRIRSVHSSIAAAYLVFTALVIGFVSTAATAITLGLQSRDEFATNADKVVLGPAHEVLFNIEPKYFLALSLLLMALASILLASKLRARYEATLVNRTSGFRWIASGLSMAALLTYVNLLAGITDLATLKLSAALLVATSIFAFLADRENAASVRPKWVAYLASIFTGVMAWVPVLSVLLGTYLFGDERFGWHVYAIAAVTLLGSTSIALNQLRQLRAGVRKEYTAIEASYLNIDLLTKFAVVLLTLLALQ